MEAPWLGLDVGGGPVGVQGTVRDDNAAPGEQPATKCSKCEDGFVAMKELNLAHLFLEPEQQLPAEFQTGCSQGDCSATKAWRMVGGALSSGFHEAPSVAVRPPLVSSQTWYHMPPSCLLAPWRAILWVVHPSRCTSR